MPVRSPAMSTLARRILLSISRKFLAYIFVVTILQLWAISRGGLLIPNNLTRRMITNQNLISEGLKNLDNMPLNKAIESILFFI
jgi:hypothetical protein